MVVIGNCSEDIAQVGARIVNVYAPVHHLATCGLQFSAPRILCSDFNCAEDSPRG